ncbi:hypothetical protein VN97_g7530 [Penicillium thymicola]|uniref:Uncharacterized protein n=1 Tax=Penicillium thymicola TaxID=293382 RepID=A0AAI9TEV8_PENTH|nr:hypothetical protein VN97_g7530 [Penicillium thymicola]
MVLLILAVVKAEPLDPPSNLICPGKQGVVRPRARRRKEEGIPLAPPHLLPLCYFSLFLFFFFFFSFLFLDFCFDI